MTRIRLTPPRRAAVAAFWAAGLAVGAITAALGVASGLGAPPSTAYYEYNAPRVARFAAETKAAPGAARVVLIGGPALKYATMPPRALEARARELGLGALRVLRLVDDADVFDSLGRFATPVLAAEPDIVVVQRDLLGRARRGPASGASLLEYLSWTLFGAGVWNPGGYDHRALQFDAGCAEPASAAPPIAPAHADARAARAFVADAAERGVRVVVLDMPLRPPAPADPPERASAAFDRALDALLRRAHVERARYPDALAADRFCDAARLNAAGRTVFSDWLLHRLRPVPGRLAARPGAARSPRS